MSTMSVGIGIGWLTWSAFIAVEEEACRSARFEKGWVVRGYDERDDKEGEDVEEDDASDEDTFGGLGDVAPGVFGFSRGGGDGLDARVGVGGVGEGGPEASPQRVLVHELAMTRACQAIRRRVFVLTAADENGPTTPKRQELGGTTLSTRGVGCEQVRKRFEYNVEREFKPGGQMDGVRICSVMVRTNVVEDSLPFCLTLSNFVKKSPRMARALERARKKP
ncbi:hypothetical protein C8R42DRAFT_715628 [Lentinula raphanica]|nr:hypothetical protein C8R42DRAFT_715628 [Lentinula raphanica]